MHDIKRLLFVVLSCVVSSGAFCQGSVEIRRAELESFAKLVFFCEDMDDPNPAPTPYDLKQKYNLTNDEVAGDIRWLVHKYGPSETNAENRICREKCVSWLGIHGCTNDIPLLLSIMNNPADYARRAAIGASISLLKNSSELMQVTRAIVTNVVSFSQRDREWTYCQLESMCCDVRSSCYVSNSAQRQLICSFVLEMAGCERDIPLCVDRRACRMAPSYRHSQQRRDNLAAARPPNLTGKPAELYDAAQNDAAQND